MRESTKAGFVAMFLNALSMALVFFVVYHAFDDPIGYMLIFAVVASLSYSFSMGKALDD